MNVLREQLRSQSPELHAALERSWEVAFDEWLPAISPKKDSFNSYPHIRNLESYLGKLVVAHGRREQKTPLFTSLELYVLLVCILLHDIGKAGDSQDSEKKDRASRHDKRSERIINANWAHLGIPSLGLALSIAKICGVHDAEPNDLTGELSRLSTIVVDPFGQIRERELASVLILIDHMDATCLRTVADYLKQGDLLRGDGEILGAFRKRIRGVDVDLNGGLVKVVLGEEWALEPQTAQTEPQTAQTEPRTAHTEPRTAYAEIVGLGQPDIVKLGRLRKELQGSEQPDLVVTIHSKPSLDGNSPATTRYVQTCDGGVARGAFEYKLLTTPEAKLKLFHGKDAPGRVDVPQDRFLLTMLMRDTYENHRILQGIADILGTVGLPLRDWQIEYQEHLFDWNGRESYEPVLSADRMKKTLERAWKLSTQIFAAGQLSYATLAAELGEPCPQSIKMALHRLNIIASGTEGIPRPFWLSDNEWRWAAPELDPEKIPNSHKECPFQRSKEAKEPEEFFKSHKDCIQGHRKLHDHIGRMGKSRRMKTSHDTQA